MAAASATSAAVPAQDAPRAEVVLSQQEFQVLATKAICAHETATKQAKAQLEVDFLLQDEGLKQEMADAMAAAVGNDKRVTAFKLVTTRLLADQIPGARRLSAESDEHLRDGLLRFKPQHVTAKEGKPWVWSLAPGHGITQNFREALADLVASGGNSRVQIRRPQQFWGPAVSALAQSVLGKEKGEKGTKGKDKGKGKGNKDKDKGQVVTKGKGKGRGRGQGHGKGKTVDVAPAAAFVVPAEAPPVLASSGASPSYAALAAADDDSMVSAEVGYESAKRDGELLEPPIPMKKSNSPAADRGATASSGGVAH